MPALNEEDALPPILARMPEIVGRVVVADNGSTDATAEVARTHGADAVLRAWPGSAISRN